MTSLTDAIQNRRSVRRFKDQELPEPLMHEILTAAQWAQSWANTQCWELILVKDKTILTSLQETILPKNPATKSITGAPVVIAVCGKQNVSGYYKEIALTKFGDWMLFDLGIVTQNICLTAHAQGLGSVVVGSFDHEKAQKVLSIPPEYDLVCLIPIGYPEKIPKAPKRKEINEFMHMDQF